MTRREGVAAVLLWSVLVFLSAQCLAPQYISASRFIPEWGGNLPQSVDFLLSGVRVPAKPWIAFGLLLLVQLPLWQ